jgi:hypothetical protein
MADTGQKTPASTADFSEHRTRISPSAHKRFGVADAYPMWIDSVKLVSRTGQLRMSHEDVELLWNLGHYERGSSSMTTSLVDLGYWGAWRDAFYVVANGSWALNEPPEFAEDLESLGELRPCRQCPELTDALVSLASGLGAINRRSIVEELNDFFALAHRNHTDPTDR